MSDVLFQTENVTAVLGAAERARAATIVDDLALGLLAPNRPAVARRLHGLLDSDHFLRSVPVDTPAWVEGFRAAFTGHVDTGLIRHDDRTVETFALALNTAILVGNDTIRFLAWLHAECEPHGYLEQPQRPWAAGIVEDGLGTGLLRRGVGWEAVLELLRDADSGPVVLSVVGQDELLGDGTGGGGAPWEADSPGRSAGAPPDAAAGDRWSAAMRRLRADTAVTALDPRSIREPYGHGLTVLDLVAADWSERLSRVPAKTGR